MGICHSYCFSTGAVIASELVVKPREKEEDCIIKFALKFPNGLKGLSFNKAINEFEFCENINTWLSSLYFQQSWEWWFAYNDETGHLGDKHHKKGHCKGIVAWSAHRISWLCHSIPNFPEKFTGDSISNIEEGELIFGQSMQYMEFFYTEKRFNDILKNIEIMQPHIFMKHVPNGVIPFETGKTHALEISPIILSEYPKVVHLAKSPYCEIDIYEEYIAKKYSNSGRWKVETWIRGHHIDKKEDDAVEDITHVHFRNVLFTEKQDHSKWTVSESDLYGVGDLNRMTSQFHRGGGVFICEHGDIAKALRALAMVIA
jgi:hypothetical protein